MILITPLPGVTTTKPGSATFPFPGIAADVVDADGDSVPLGGGGYLVLKRPWPAMLRGIYGDPERYRQTYWSRFPGMYFAGDGAKRDEDGYFWLLGRVDDVMNVAGHRISTTEVESALVDHPLGRRGRGRRGKDEITRPGDLSPSSSSRPAASRPTPSPCSCASTSPTSSARSPSPKYLMFMPGPAQDPLGQDHAPAPPRHRRGPHARRHDDARRRDGRRDDPREHRQGRGVGMPFGLGRKKEAPPAPSPGDDGRRPARSRRRGPCASTG